MKISREYLVDCLINERKNQMLDLMEHYKLAVESNEFYEAEHLIEQMNTVHMQIKVLGGMK